MTGAGLCNSHGHCAYDPYVEEPHCFCNEGYGGDSCSKNASTANMSEETIGLTLVIILVVVTVALIGVVIVMSLKIMKARQVRLYWHSSLHPFLLPY